MASVVDDPNGRRRILFVAPDEKRKTIRLGKCDRKSAESICRHVEALLSAKIGGQPLSRETAVWLAEIGSQLRDKLARVGLVETVTRLSFGEFLVKWNSDKKAAGFKPTSLPRVGTDGSKLDPVTGQSPTRQRKSRSRRGVS